jgi:hypothetical protein
MLVIGSQALFWRTVFLKDVKFREPSDLDVICSKDEALKFAAHYQLTLKELAPHKWAADNAPGFGHVEFELLEESESGRAYLEYINTLPESERLHGSFLEWAPASVLYSIKRSHRHYPRMWQKHIWDYHLLKTMVDGVDVLADITKIRERETEERYGKLKTPSLNKNAQDFFDDNVSNRTFVHDDIHAVMAHREKPMFEYIKVSLDKVACSKAKFFELAEADRVRCVLEEAYVIALERCIIPMLFAGGRYTTSEEAIAWAIMRICTTLCSGWFRDYATENYPLIHGYYDRRYVEKFLTAVQEGRIKRIVKS